jgi:hypothetical protein
MPNKRESRFGAPKDHSTPVSSWESHREWRPEATRQNAAEEHPLSKLICFKDIDRRVPQLRCAYPLVLPTDYSEELQKKPLFRDALRIRIRQSSVVSAENYSSKERTMKMPSILDWYRILRAHHHWTAFQAIRYALWLGR